jgi:hypothetical protein
VDDALCGVQAARKVVALVEAASARIVDGVLQAKGVEDEHGVVVAQRRLLGDEVHRAPLVVLVVGRVRALGLLPAPRLVRLGARRRRVPRLLLLFLIVGIRGGAEEAARAPRHAPLFDLLVVHAQHARVVDVGVEARDGGARRVEKVELA